MSRIYLSPPHLGQRELEYLHDAMESNWIAPLGPHVEAFERAVATAAGRLHGAALSSGTAALHLALKLLGIGPGDEVYCSDLTFVASTNAITYLGATPVLVDCDPGTWTLDPALLASGLEEAARNGRLPRAVVCVDLYGQCADLDAISETCANWGVPLIEDAAEALGATYRGRPAGSAGHFAIFSFNGNKIITTSGGGMVVTDDEKSCERIRFLASQAREPSPHYEHREVGYNYRLSNLLAAVGRGQLEVLTQRVEARRQVFARYYEILGGLPGLEFMPEASYGTATRWLTVVTIDADTFGASSDEIRRKLAQQEIEARPVWKPMHLQPLYRDAKFLGGGVSARLFRTGLCLPSGSQLTEEQIGRIAEIVRSTGHHS